MASAIRCEETNHPDMKPFRKAGLRKGSGLSPFRSCLLPMFQIVGTIALGLSIGVGLMCWIHSVPVTLEIGAALLERAIGFL